MEIKRDIRHKRIADDNGILTRDARLARKKWWEEQGRIGHPLGAKVRFKKDIVTKKLLIMNAPEYSTFVEDYKNFIESNKNTIFTVEWDDSIENQSLWVTFEEDTNNPKWLFWHGFLEEVDQEMLKKEGVYL